MSRLNEYQLGLLSVFEDVRQNSQSFDTIVVKREFDRLEILLDFEPKNKYRAFDKIGRHLLYIAEEPLCVDRQLNQHERAFKIHVFDSYMNDVVTLQSPTRHCCGLLSCCHCCSPQVHVFCCAQEIGYIREVCAWRGKFVVYTNHGSPMYQIYAPYWLFSSCCREDVFHIYQYQGNVSIATIRKKPGGTVNDLFGDADAFGFTFPKEMHAQDKALLFAAIFLIDFLYYENTIF